MMMKTFISELGVTITGRTRAGEEFVENFAKDEAICRERERKWISFLRDIGIKGALRNDGWVKREQKYFRWASYAFFDDGVKEGDGDWYCPNCKAYIVDERVTYEETCDMCGAPCQWHGSPYND
jgi:hypothetical protein